MVHILLFLSNLGFSNTQVEMRTCTIISVKQALRAALMGFFPVHIRVLECDLTVDSQRKPLEPLERLLSKFAVCPAIYCIRLFEHSDEDSVTFQSSARTTVKTHF